MTKEAQYNEYLTWGGTMTIEEWEADCRYDRSLDPDNNAPYLQNQREAEVKELNILLTDERDPEKIKIILAKLAHAYQSTKQIL